MPRNGSGTYTLPQPSFVSNTVISSSAVNSDFSDIASALTTSICSDGQTSLTGAIKNQNGSAGTPGVSFAGDATTGLYLPSAGTLGLSANGTSVGTSTSTATTWNLNTTISGTLTASSTVAITGAVTVTSATMTLAGNQVSTSWVLLNTLNASSSATLSDTSHLTSTYSNYVLVLQNLVPATNAVTLRLQVHSGGAFQTTGYLTSTLAWAAGTSAAGTGTGSVSLSNAGSADISNNSSEGVSGIVYINGPVTGTSVVKVITAHTGYFNTSSGATGTTTTGWWNSSVAAIDGFQISFSSGNISTGTVLLYGIL